MAFCRKCGTKVPAEAEFCPECGTRTTRAIAKPAPPNQRLQAPAHRGGASNKKVAGVVGAIAVIVVAMVVVLLISRGGSTGLSITSASVHVENYVENSLIPGAHGAFVLDLYVQNNGSSTTDIESYAMAYEGLTARISWGSTGYPLIVNGVASYFGDHISIQPGESKHITSSSRYNFTTAGFDPGQTYYLTLKIYDSNANVLTETPFSVYIPTS